MYKRGLAVCEKKIVFIDALPREIPFPLLYIPDSEATLRKCPEPTVPLMKRDKKLMDVIPKEAGMVHLKEGSANSRYLASESRAVGGRDDLYSNPKHAGRIIFRPLSCLEEEMKWRVYEPPSIGIMRKGATGYAQRTSTEIRAIQGLSGGTPIDDGPYIMLLESTTSQAARSFFHLSPHHSGNSHLGDYDSFTRHTKANSHAYRNTHDAAVAPQWNEECPGPQRRKDARDTSGPRRGDTITMRHTRDRCPFVLMERSEKETKSEATHRRFY
ncbi:hypothetical protein EV421DRAFT_2026168 [Armillaria borealis]|uniref:Uncharacterized protein n=1 Tax=Armillaria borealis TaxID=47425 RepID=A0AA39ICM4_9AGAR|nr:hypothetical protein EV421DRAFT_2026168 [Armillaria borealis]